ncbi:D-sedoheptulose-7-phosphate isomerase [Mangrovibrevibacter kandeliae]|uniref:D-sedoheptulose-7-phosphate isomerase n=1 Tax=Mangrovibrevibacter kandeliae TaxID=2968473 RepID=UPI0021195997|nr:SIS domain-containing protein [Aurantimonas sp. CSK15Z-1]MCQ8782836.1 SIS domain-containing protein [Aurantimonas sp. CSK15Z-1]
MSQPSSSNPSAGRSPDAYRGYVAALARLLDEAKVTDRNEGTVAIGEAVLLMAREMRACHARGRRILFVGNGGSAGICSHLATDFSKNGGMRASAFNDGAVLTCLGNDYGYEHVFAKQIEWHAAAGDVLVAISSSGRSANILNAVAAARARDCVVYTLSGFKPDNPLRTLGDLNIFVDSPEYGFVEVGHLAILHSVLDIEMGWNTTHG